MLFRVNKKGITLYCTGFMIREYYRRIRRQRSRMLKKVSVSNCPFVEGLWCHNEDCYGPACVHARLINGQLDDGQHGYFTSKTPADKFEGKTLAKQASITVN